MNSHPIKQGDIYWLDNADRCVATWLKRRPVVVVTPTPLIEATPEVLIVACTSSILASDTMAIELPSRERTPQTNTGLMRRTWAVPEWLLPVESQLLTDYIGRLGGATLRRLLDAVAKANPGKP